MVAMVDRLSAYRKRIVRAYQREFALHAKVASTLEAALLSSRPYPTHSHLVLDMLMVQCLKAHATVLLLTQHGLMEDSSTIARRLLELSVQAVYIGMEDDDKERNRRSGAYLAFMWRQLPQQIKRKLPLNVRQQWVGIARGNGRFVKPKAIRWGPDFRTMFKAIGVDDLYVSDYSFLSSIAHGSPDQQVFQYSASTIRVHSDQFAPILLVYSSRYYLAAAEAWNHLFGILDTAQFATLMRLVSEWQYKGGAVVKEGR